MCLCSLRSVHTLAAATDRRVQAGGLVSSYRQRALTARIRSAAPAEINNPHAAGTRSSIRTCATALVPAAQTQVETDMVWNYSAAEVVRQLLSSSSNTIQGAGSVQSADATNGSSTSSEDPGQLEIGYRTADSVAVVKVPCASGSGAWQLMARKESQYMQEGKMDSYKFASAQNEWDMYTKHCLRHRNLVHLLGFSKAQGTIQIYSEYCCGGDVQGLLSQHLTDSDGRGLDEQAVWKIACDVLAGLNQLHSSNLVYGDLKPANVFIGKDDQGERVYRIGDYGTTREVGRQFLHYFVSSFGFTAEYASPETLRCGTSKTGKQADLWSLAIMLAELVTGKLPPMAVEFARLHALQPHNQDRQRDRHLQAHPPRGYVEGLPVSPGLKEVLRACLCVKPEQRPHDAQALMRFAWFAKGP